MKLNKLFMMIGISASLLSSCKKDFGDINVNPNVPSDASTRFLFSSAVVGIRNNAVTGINGAAGELYSQFMAEYVYNSESRYQTKFFSYNSIYAGPLADIQKIIDLNTDPTTKDTKEVLENGTNANQLGHARILRAFLMLHITDRWGDVPYFEALKGNDNLQPKFDAQKTIYNDLLKELKEAPMQITAAMPNDPLFAGNFAKWKRWGNSLRAIVALRMSKTEDAAVAQAAFQEAIAAGIMTVNTDNAVISNLANSTYESPWYTNYVRNARVDYGVSNTMIDFLNATNDPRKPIYARPLANGSYVGIPYGKNASYGISQYSRLGTTITSQTFPLQLTTYAQMCFTMAEGALRGWIPGGDAIVADWYKKGVNASMAYWSSISTPAVPITTAQIDAYTNQVSVSLPAASTLTFNEKLERIQTQKWANFYMNNGYEAWAEWRRTGYPMLTPAIDPLNIDKQIPRRQAYPTSEKDLNLANYNEVIQRQGPDELATRLWWDRP
jgi:hypothetical protein